ncbi:MAG: hypothetical protein L0G60_08225, partial [Acinetobacter sp.]|nr:hypothetical protein [Acinetobacter sp.]
YCAFIACFKAIWGGFVIFFKNRICVQTLLGITLFQFTHRVELNMLCIRSLSLLPIYPLPEFPYARLSLSQIYEISLEVSMDSVAY